MTGLKKKSKCLAAFVVLALVLTVVSVVAVKQHNENKKRQIAQAMKELELLEEECSFLMFKYAQYAYKMTVRFMNPIERIQQKNLLDKESKMFEGSKHEGMIESNMTNAEMKQRLDEAHKKKDETLKKLNKLGVKPEKPYEALLKEDREKQDKLGIKPK